MSRFGKLFLVASTGATFLMGGCLPDNFWADKFGEVVNTTIMEAYNTLVLDNIIGIIPV